MSEKMTKFRFKPEDFSGYYKHITPSDAMANIANELLDKAIAKCPVIYGTPAIAAWGRLDSTDTHKAVLFNIEDIVIKPPCKHEPIMHAFNANAVLPSSEVETKCRHCGITLKARWEAAE
jgi:hypothetical protein